MLPKKTSRRKCRDDEREWRGFCVDRNLEDDWLARLNDLGAFDLISICEGHCGRQTEPARTPPHIKLRLKERLLPDIASRWDDHKMAILGKVNELFQVGDTYVNLELKFKLRSGTGRLSYQEEMIMRVHGLRARAAGEMGPVTRAWFQQSVERIEEVDRFVANLWQSEDE
jgi:hypothetical protein